MLQQRRDQPRRVIVREGLQRDRRRVRLPASPCRAPLQQLRPRRSDDEKRNAAEPVDEIVKEVQQAVVRPVQVLEHENGRPALGDSLEKATPGRSGCLRTGTPAAVPAQPDERAQLACEPARLAHIRRERRYGVFQLPLGLVGAVGLEDPRLRLDDLAELSP